MVTRKVFSLMTVVLIFLALCGLALAQGPRAPRGRRAPAGDLLRMREYLGLTEHQVNDMKALVQKQRDAATPLAEEMRAKREALRAALNGAEPNPTAVGQLVLAQRSLSKQMRALREKLRTDMLAILTAEQKDKLLLRGPGRGPGGRRMRRGPR